MIIKTETTLQNFNAWSGGRDTLNSLTWEQCNALESMIEEIYPDELTDTNLNDLLWFERDLIAEWLGFECWDELEEHNKEEKEE